MAKNKTIFALALFIILLVVVLLIQEDPYEPPKDKKFPELPKIETDSIDKVEIVNKTEGITFEKKGESWETTSPKEYRVDNSFKTLVVEKLSKIALDRTVSENKERHEKFEVDEKGTRVKVFSKNSELLSIIVGKNTPDYRGTFVRFPDSDVVYATTEIIGGSLKRKLKDWRNKRLFDGLNKDKVQKATFHLEKETYAFEWQAPEPIPDAEDGTPAKPGKWILVGDASFPVDKNRANSTLSALTGMPWADIVDEPESLKDYGLDNPRQWVEFTTRDDNKKYKLLIGNYDEKKKMAWMAIEGAPKVYEIRKYQYDHLTKEKNYYRGDSSK